MTIDWGAFAVVLAATVLGAGSIVLFFSLGIRLGAEAGSAGPRGRALLRVASAASYTLSAIAVAFGVYLIVPYFHR